MPENVEQRQRTARVSIVLWTLAAVTVTVTVIVACSYVRSGRTSADRDRGNVRSAAGANGTSRDGTSDLDGPGHHQTRDVDASGTQAAVTVTGGAAVRDGATGKVDRSDSDVSRGFYRATSADGSVRVVHQNVYSTIDDDGNDDGRPAAGITRDADATATDERHRYVHRNGGGGYHLGAYHYRGRLPSVPLVEAEERPARRTDWKTVAALAAVAKLASAKLAAVGLLQFAFVLGFKLLLAAAAVSVKWQLLLKLGKVFHALAVVPSLLLLLLAASRSLASVGSSQAPSGQLQSGGGGFSGSSSLQTLLSGPTAGDSSEEKVLRPGASSSTVTAAGRRTPEAFQKASRDRERCVERAACRAAADDKAGGVMVPARIDRILIGVSKAVPDEKIKLYFKTYNDVNLKMYSTPKPSQVNWESWCLERYHCNGVNATMTEAKNKK